jgi:TonB family protein
MLKKNSAMHFSVLSLILLAVAVAAQNEKPPQAYADAMAALSESDYPRAAAHFRQAIAERPSMLSAHYYLGLSLRKMENYVEALNAYRGLVEIDPDNIAAHYEIGKIYLEIKDYPQAVEKYLWLKRQSESPSAAPADQKEELLPDQPRNRSLAPGAGQKKYAGELAEYLLDMIPREIAEQHRLPQSEIVYGAPPKARADPNRRPEVSPASGATSGGSAPIKPMSASLRPTITYREKAKYTEIARINRTQGTVALSVVFSDEGRLTDIRVVRGLPDGLTQNAIKAAHAIRFQPATKDGEPVSVRGNLEYTFNLY